MKKNLHSNRWQAVAADGAVDWDHPLNVGRIGWWVAPPGLPNAGTRLLNLCSRLYQGTLTNFTTPSPGVSGWMAGTDGFGTIYYDGVDDNVVLNNGYILGGLANFSIFATFQTTAVGAGGGTRPIYCERAASGNDILRLEALDVSNAPNSMLFSYRNDGGTILQQPGTIVINNGKLNRAGVVKTGTNIALYVNGYLDASGTFGSASDAFTDASPQVLLGADLADNTIWWTQKLQEVSIWTRSLSLQDIQADTLHALRNYKAPDSPLRWFSTRTWSTPTAIAFDAASNSGFQTASSNYTFNRTVGTGANRFLRVEVPILGTPGTTVTSITDDDGGGNVAMTFIGRGSSGTGAGIVEFWGLVNPVSGTKAIRIILSGAVTSAGLAASYANVQQTSPYANFNSAQATNVGAADATVAITTVATGSWAVAAIATTDSTGITAGQTSRNNINAAGAAGAGADEDTNAAVAPGTTNMTYPAVDALATWVIGGYELRPATASSLTTIVNRKTFSPVGTRAGSRQVRI